MHVNQNFQEAISLKGPKTAFRLIFDDHIVDHTNFLLDAKFDFVCESFVGELPSAQLVAKFIYDEKTSYLEKKFNVEVCAFDEDGLTENWIPLGSFLVDEDGQETDETNQQITITAHDNVSFLNQPYQPVSLPATGAQIEAEILARNGLEKSEEATTLPLASYVFETLNIGEGSQIYDRAILKDYYRLNMAFGFADRNGKIRSRSVFEETPISDTSLSFSYDSIGLKLEPEYGPINALVYGNRADGVEESYQEVYARDEDSIIENGLKELKIHDNIFMDLLDESEQQSIVNQLFTLVNDFSYTPFELEMFARPDLDPGDLIPLSNKDEMVSVIPITSYSISYDGGLIETMSTDALPETLTEYVIEDVNTRKVSNALIRVNKAEGSITSLAEKQDDQSLQLTKIAQEVDNIKVTIKDGGGANLIKNSVGYAGTEYWSVISEPLSSVSSWVLQGTSKHGWSFENGGELSQSLALSDGHQYTVTGKALKASQGGFLNVSINGESFNLGELDTFNGSFTLTFEHDQGLYPEPEIVISGSGVEVELTDVGVYEGNAPSTWQQNAGEVYTLNVQIDSKGLRVYSPDKSSYTVMSPEEFAGYYNEQKVFTVNQDITEVMGLLIKGKGLYIPPVKFIQNQTGTKKLSVVWTG